MGIHQALFMRSGGGAGGTVVTIGSNTGDSGSTQDNRIDSLGSLVDSNFGAHTQGYCGVTSGRELRELQRFDLSSIPSGSTCISAELRLFDTNWGNRTADLTLNIYKIADANGNWIEGTGGTVGSVDAGSPCWNYKAYNTAPWAGSAGLSTPGTDYINTSLGSAVLTDGVSGYRAITLNSDGRAYLETLFGTTGGNGWILIGTGSNGCWTEFRSRNGTNGQRPFLQIQYS